MQSYERYNSIMAVLPLLGLTALTTTNQTLAWGHWHGGYFGHEWNEGGLCCGFSVDNHWGGCYDNVPGSVVCCSVEGSGTDDGGYNARIADAVYDHTNNLAYNPIGSCLSCKRMVGCII